MILSVFLREREKERGRERKGRRVFCLQVKVVGTLALIDEGETDWKLVAIDVNDALAPKINNISDVDEHFPGLLKVGERERREGGVIRKKSIVK